MNEKMIVIGVFLLISPLIIAYLVRLVDSIGIIIECIKNKKDIRYTLESEMPVLFGIVGGIGIILIIYGAIGGK